MKLNPATFRTKLMELLFADALRLQGGTSYQEAALLGASMLEAGKRCPRWIASPLVPRAFQDAYGAAGMLLPRAEIEAVFNSCIEGE